MTGHKAIEDRSNRRWAIGFTAVAVFLFVLYHWIVPNGPSWLHDFVQGWFSNANTNEMIVYIIMALGLNVVVGYAGLLDLGFVAFWAIGGYVAGWLMSSFLGNFKINIFGNPAPGLEMGIHVTFWWVLLAAGGFCAIWGIIIGAPTLRLKSDYLALVTLGFGEIIPQVFINGQDINGFNLSNGNQGITPIDPIRFFGFRNLGPFDLDYKFVIYAVICAGMVMVSLRLRQGRLGRAWLAIREDELAASMMGVPLMRTKLAAYAVGAFSGGLGGVVFATHINGIFAERFNFSISILILAMVVLGGMGNVWGVMVGAIVLSWINGIGLQQFGNTVNGAFNTNIDFPSFNFLIFGSLLILMMMFRREGFIPEARVRLVIHEHEDDNEEVH